MVVHTFRCARDWLVFYIIDDIFVNNLNSDRLWKSSLGQLNIATHSLNNVAGTVADLWYWWGAGLEVADVCDWRCG